MPAAAWAARSGDPVLFTGEDELPKPTAAALQAHTRRSRSTCSAPPRRSPPTVVREIAQDRRPGAAASPARTRSPTRSPSPATPTAASAGTSTTPATASSSPATTRRSTPPPRRRSRPPAPGGRCCSPTAPIRCRRRCASYLLDVKPGYTTDPTRAFYNHVWVIGDQEAIDVNQQAEIDELAELAKIGGERVSEAENPELLGGAHEVTRRGHPRPRRRLHPPLRAAGPQPHPPPDRAAARRPPGPARRRAQDRPRWRSSPSTAATRAGTHGRSRADRIKQLGD